MTVAAASAASSAPLASALLLFVAILLAGAEGPARRLERLRPTDFVPRPPRTHSFATTQSRALVSMLVALGPLLLARGMTGRLLALAVGAGCFRMLGRSASAGAAAQARAVTRALPGACELLAACVAAGASPSTALAAVAGVVDAPLSRRLGDVARALSLGAPPEEAWQQLLTAPLDPGERRLASACVRAQRDGVPLGSVLEPLADEARAARRRAGEAAAQRAGVLAAAPLGLCFLPAFFVIGVVPLVASLASDVISRL